MEKNLKEYIGVKKKYPNNVFLVRYEDVSIDTMKFSTEFLTKILNLSRNENVRNFIQINAIKKKKKMKHRKYSTIRNYRNLTFI